MSLLMVAEFALWAAFGFLFWTRNLHRRFPAMGVYLALRVVSMPVFLIFFYGQTQQWFNGHSSNMYSALRCPLFPGSRGLEPWSFAGRLSPQ
jgi:hypothetical protein